MPERELPRNLLQQLSASLESGAPLASPLPSQARYAALRGALPAPRWRLRALTVAVAAAGIVLVGLAGPAQPRQWFVQSVNDITRQVGIPEGSTSPSPSTGGPGSRLESPEPSESPEANEPAEAGRTPQPGASPEPAESPEGGEHAQPSPSPSPSPEQHDGDGGGGSGDGDHSPEPSPSS